MVLQVVVLSANGETRQSRLTGSEVTGAAIAKLCRKTKPASEVAVYDTEEVTLTVWGWAEGKAGAENKHELPPPSDELLLFGDAVVTAAATEDGALQGFSVAQWEAFYKEAFKGFHETGSDSGSESDSDEEDAASEAEEEEEVADEEVADEEASEGGSAEEGDTESEGSDSEGSEGAASEEDEADEENEDCYEDGDEGGGGGGKRRAPRRRTAAAPEYRRFEMGLRSRVKVPMPVGRRAPRWQTAAELVEEPY
jgi:hypothetical protein